MPTAADVAGMLNATISIMGSSSGASQGSGAGVNSGSDTDSDCGAMSLNDDGATVDELQELTGN